MACARWHHCAAVGTGTRDVGGAVGGLAHTAAHRGDRQEVEAGVRLHLEDNHRVVVARPSQSSPDGSHLVALRDDMLVVDRSTRKVTGAWKASAD